MPEKTQKPVQQDISEESDAESTLSKESSSEQDSSSENNEMGKKRSSTMAQLDSKQSSKRPCPPAPSDNKDHIIKAFNEWVEEDAVKSVRIISDKKTGKKKGFGYVEFQTAEQAQKALKCHGKELDGRPIRLDLSVAKPVQEKGFRAEPPKSAPSDTLFVANLSYALNEVKLREIFSQHGQVMHIRLPSFQDSGKLKGFGYVQFASVHEAKVACDTLNGTSIEGRSIRIDFDGKK